MIDIKSDDELSFIEEAGNVVRLVLREIVNASNEGVTTLELDNLAEDIIRKNKSKPAFKGYRGYPSSICTSINEQVVHGIPSVRKLKDGDILSIDVGVEKSGFFADSALTIGIGRHISKDAQDLIKTTEQALFVGIKNAIAGNRLFDISYAIQEFTETNGYSVVRDFVGHGIGKMLHEEPSIPNYGKKGSGPRLKNNMVFAIEPMINQGDHEVEILNDGWTAVTKDRKLSAHFEHTICIRDKEPKILT